MKKICIITTTGCVACNILKSNVKEALSYIKNNDITLIVRDKRDFTKNYFKINKITDFPTMLFINDDVIKFKYCGSAPVAVIYRWLTIHFK